MQARIETRAIMERAVPHRASESRVSTHTVINVGHNDGLRTDGVIDETNRTLSSLILVVSGWIIRSLLLVWNDRMWTVWDETLLGLFLRVSRQQERPPIYPHGGNNSQDIPYGAGAQLHCSQVRYLRLLACYRTTRRPRLYVLPTILTEASHFASI